MDKNIRCRISCKIPYSTHNIERYLIQYRLRKTITLIRYTILDEICEVFSLKPLQFEKLTLSISRICKNIYLIKIIIS